MQVLTIFARKKVKEDVIRMQQEPANKIVTFDDLRGGKSDIII